MTLARAQPIVRTVSRYLLFVLGCIVSLNVFGAVGSVLSVGLLAGLTALSFLLATVIDTVLGSSQGRHQPPASEWSWIGTARWEQATLVGLLILGVSLRVYALAGQSFWFDEAITTNAAVATLETGRPTFPSGYTYWRAFPHTIVVSASLFVFGISEWAARLPSVIFGGGSILATYWLGREVGGRRVGLLAAGLLTVATWEIAWSRQARMYQLFQLLYVLAIVMLMRVDRQGIQDVRRLGLLVGVIGLAAATHPIGYILLPVAVVFLATTAVLDGSVTRQTAGILVGLAVVLTVVFELVGPGITGALETVTSTDVNYWDAYVSWGASELHAFFYLAVVGTTLTAYTGARRAGLLCGVAVLPPAIILSFSTQLFATRYLYFVLPFLFVWATVTILFLGDQLCVIPERQRPRLTSTQLQSLGSVLLVCLLVFGGGFTVTPQSGYDLGVNAPQPEFNDAYEYVTEHRHDDAVVIAGWTAPGVYYAGGVDYWLAHDLTGTGGSYTVDGGERYSGAEPLRSAAALETVSAESDDVWVVVDRTAYLRQSAATQQVLATEFDTVHQVSGITVYRSTVEE